MYIHTTVSEQRQKNSKIRIAVNDTNTTKHELPAKYSTMLSEWRKKFTLILVTKKNPQGL